MEDYDRWRGDRKEEERMMEWEEEENEIRVVHGI